MYSACFEDLIAIKTEVIGNNSARVFHMTQMLPLLLPLLMPLLMPLLIPLPWLLPLSLFLPMGLD